MLKTVNRLGGREREGGMTNSIQQCAILEESGYETIPELLGEKNPSWMAAMARHTLTLNERRFVAEVRRRFPSVTWRRYHPISTPGDPDLKPKVPSVWYAPFYNAKANLIVCISEREDFPYRVYGQNRALYERHGYTVMDFTEDLSCPVDDSVWEEMMKMVGKECEITATERYHPQ